ncbi:MAG: hypothetical protein ACOC00_01905 [Halothiobacillaceae bacterium]
MSTTINPGMASLGLKMLRETAALGQASQIRGTRPEPVARVRPVADLVTLSVGGANASSPLRAASDGINLAQNLNGSMMSMTGALLRMRELAMSSSDDALSPERRRDMQAEILELNASLERTVESLSFGGQRPLEGDFAASFTLDENTRAWFQVGDLRPEGLGLSGFDVTDPDAARDGVRALDAALETVSRQRAGVRDAVETIRNWIEAPGRSGPAISGPGEAQVRAETVAADVQAAPVRALRAQANLSADAVLQWLR